MLRGKRFVASASCASAWARATQIGADKRMRAAKSLLRDQRSLAPPQLQIHLSKTLPGLGPRHVILMVHDNRGAVRTQQKQGARWGSNVAIA
jgi:hypothetical protein